jgi:membrane fusion protein (multidrug efflux system)
MMAEPLDTETKPATVLAPAVSPGVPATTAPSGDLQRSDVRAVSGQILQPQKRPRRLLLPLLLLAGIGFGGYKGYDWFVEGRFVVSTDDAYVKADKSIIAAKIAGIIASVPAADNSEVKAGDVLVTIDDGDYKLALAAANDKVTSQEATIERFAKQAVAQQSLIDQAKAQIVAAQADADRASLAFTRADMLLKSGSGTQANLDQARADRDRTAASLTSARAALEAAEANLEVLKAQRTEAETVKAELITERAKAERDLSFTIIKAPFDGVVGNRAAQVGAYVQPGTRLLALVPLDSVYVEANFKETQLARLKPGQRVKVGVDAYSARPIEGKVESLSPASGSEFSLLPPENATGNFTKIVQRLPVRISVPPELAAEGLLRPGMSVTVSVQTRSESEPRPSLVKLLGLDAFGFAKRQADLAGAGQ